ncbi:MAG: hypothetical protein ABI561_16040 [Bradyrhizobium sp.]
MDSNIVEFPASDRPILEGEVDKLHATAFINMEGEVCDLERMGAITRDLIMECAAREDSYRQLELAVFAVWQLEKMTRDFRTNYYKRWHGEQVITS